MIKIYQYAGTPTVQKTVRSDSEIVRVKAICLECPWNVNWICEHPACRVCPGKQRKTGALLELLKRPSFKCSASNF